MKRARRPAKVQKHEGRIYLAASLLPECPDYLLSSAKQIRPLLTKTKFDENGFRNISKADLIEIEWNFSEITSGIEATRASAYEYLRECKSAYDFQIQALTELHSREEWLAVRKDLLSKWPPCKQSLFANHVAWGLFPRPFLSLPADLVGKMRNTIDQSTIRELNEEDFIDFKGLVESTPAGQSQMFTCHRLVIQWNAAGIGTIQADLLKWLGTIESPSLKSDRGRARHLIVEDELAHLSAWRASRACFSYSEYNKLATAAHTPDKKSGGFVRQYGERRAYDNAVERAEERILELQDKLRPN